MVERRERRLVDVTEIPDARLRTDALDRVPIRPTRPPSDDELWHAGAPVDDERQRAVAAAQLAVGGEKSRIVLARLNRPDRQDEPGLDALGQLSRRDLLGQALLDHLHLLLEPGDAVQLH